ncbi:MAG: SCO family protein [Bacteroidota bacterium]
MKKFWILFGLLAIPSIAYLYLQTGKNNFKSLEILGPVDIQSKTVDGNQINDTVYHNISGFSLLDQDSSQVTEKIFKGKIHIASFFFTTCGTICPKMSNQMMRVQHAFEKDTNVVIVSYTVDPEHDTPSVLKEYALKHMAIQNKWFLLTGDKKTIYDLARNSYLLNAGQGDGGPDDFIHSEMFVLVDKEGRIRGGKDKKGNILTYDGTNILDVNRLLEDVNVLNLEYVKQ